MASKPMHRGRASSRSRADRTTLHIFELADIEKKARDVQKGKPISPIALQAARRLDALFAAAHNAG